jgi:UDPglucose 6-dehydrogenase
VPVGTGDHVGRIVKEINPTADVVVASNPEFLREGAAIRDFKHPDRIIVGTDDERARKVLAEIYRRSTSTRRRSCTPVDALRN